MCEGGDGQQACPRAWAAELGLADRRRGVLAVVAVGAVTAFALALSGSNVQAARTEAQHLLTLVHLPAGAQRSADEPAGAGPALSYLASVPVVPRRVDLHEFFVVPGTPGSVIEWVQRHRPAGSRQGDSGSTPEERWASLEFAARGVLRPGELVVDATQRSGGVVAVRVDSQIASLPRLAGTGQGPGAVRFVESRGLLGSVGFEPRCDPADGTVPDPGRSAPRSAPVRRCRTAPPAPITLVPPVLR